MPVGGVRVGKRPNDAVEGQPPGDLRIFDHIFAVIKIDERVMKRLSENEPGYSGEEKTEADNRPAVIPSGCFRCDDFFVRSLAHSLFVSVQDTAASPTIE